MVRSGSTSSIGPKSPSSNNNNGMSVADLEILSVAIMETIRRIRAQKQRPSLERISKWVMAHTAAKDCSFQQVHEQLEAMSASGRVLKVFNQGEYSYRDPETMTPRTCGRTPKHWKEAKQRDSPLSTPKTHKSPLISPTSPKIASPELTLIPRNSLMRHKTLQVTDYIKLVQVSLDGLSQPEGATIKDMDKYLETTYYIEGISAIEFSRHLRLACKRLVNAGRLMRDGLVFRLSTNPPITPEAKTTNGAPSSEENSKNKEPLASPLALLVCSYCCGTEQCNKDGNAESLLSCVDCGNSGHPSCMKVSPDLAANLRGDLRWQCIECKSCQVCGSKGNADNLLFCDSCDRGIHMECCTPPLTKMPKGTFVCELCKTSDVHKKRGDLEHGKLPSRGPGRPPHAQRRLLAPGAGTTPPRSTGSMKNGSVGEKPQEVLSESGQHFLQVPFDKKPKGLIDGMTKFFTPSMGGRKTMTSQARTTQLMIMKQSGVSASECTSANEEEENISTKSTDPAKKSCKANITEVDENMFFRAREESLQRTGVVEGKHPDPSAARCPENIEFGKYSIETWYSSPYPQEYARLKKLYLCEFCLKYMKSRAILHRHAKKCQWFHPPANEIYRSNNLSVFEVDGNVSKIYCQNLCLLAKLFLDHKTLYYDVEPFSFYCLTINDSKGCHLIGYFSKEKHCQQKYNVSCIMTMPQYQRQGYGRFLIDFSYLLSRKEGQAGSPEKPLSDLGQVSYNAYWKSALLEFLSTRTETKLISLRDISKATGICPHDVASALQSLGMIKVLKSKDENSPQQFKFNLARKRQVLSEYMNKRESMRNDPSRPPRPTLDPDCLRWTPLVASTSFLSDESGLRSPSTTPEKRPPLAPTSRLNLGATSKQESAVVESHNSSDIENIEVTAPEAQPDDSNEAKENLPTLSEPEKPILNQPITTVDLKPSNQDEPITMQDLSDSNQDRPITNDDISKGFLPPSSVVQRKRGRPRKNPGMAPLEPEGPEEGSSPGSLMNSRKKRRRRVKGYPWGKVKKKKNKFSDNSSDKLDTSDSEKPTRGNGWRMGGPHFSSESEDENDNHDDLKHPPLEASDTMSSEMSQLDTNSIEDVPKPPESCSPEDFAALSQIRKRRRRKSKGYQWGTKKRKIKKTFVSVLRRVTGGAVAKRNNQAKISGLVTDKLKEVAAKVDAKKPKQTTMDRFFQPRPNLSVAKEGSASSSNNNNINLAESKSSPEVKSLSNALSDSKHVVVASVTISPTKSPLKHPQLSTPEAKRKQSAFVSPGSEPKQRRRSAIASDNFVASCLLSTRTPRRETIEKKRPRGRPRINFPPELEAAPNSLEDQTASPPQEADAPESSSEVKEPFLAQSPHIQNEAVSNNKPKAEGTVAFAQPWIANVSSGSSNVAQSSHNSFTLAHEGRFKDMSFKAANTNALGQNKKVKAAINWQSPSLTTYRDMNQINDEDIDISSSSSSEAESSSCSSAESSCDNSSDEEQNELRGVGEDLSSTNQQWRGSEKTKRLMKLKISSQSSENKEDVGATGPDRERLGVKRGRGRPRKYPPKDSSGVSEKTKAKKKSKKAEEVREKIKLTVRRTSVGYHTTHTEDAAPEQRLSESSAPNSPPQHQEEPKSPEEKPPKAEDPAEPERIQLSESGEDSDSDGNFSDKKDDKSALRCHDDPTLPTWAPESSATSQDCWGRKSPDAIHTSSSSANSLAMDDDVAMTTVFPTMSGIRPSSALENNSSSIEDRDGSKDAQDEVEDTRAISETSAWKPQQTSTTAEEENEINAAVASITQLDAPSPLVTGDYPGATIVEVPHLEPSPHPIDPALIRLDRHDDDQQMLSHDDEAQPASHDVDQNLLNDDDEAQNPPNNDNQDEEMLTYDDEGGEKMMTHDAQQPMLSQDDEAQSPDQTMEATITEEDQFLESSGGLHPSSGGDFPSTMGEMQGFDPQSELPLATASQPQCHFNQAPYSGEFVSTNSEPAHVQTYQSELAFAQCQQQGGGYQDNGNLQQPRYGSDTQRMYNASCMGAQPPPAQHDVIDDNNQAVMTSPKPSYAQQVAQTTMAAPACHASVGQVHPQGSQHPHGHPAPAYPQAPGGSGSTSGYETLSNNSCSPYTSPESLNPGSCDHNTITTTASAIHIEPTFAPEQGGIPLGAGPMSVGVQQHLQANFPPSIDSGHGSEYLSSPPSLGVSSTQGTPPKPSVVPQQTLMTPEQFPQGRQLNSAGSYNNLSSPNMTQQNPNMTQQSRPSCAVGDPLHPPQNLNLMPCMVQQQRSPSVSKTPTTPQCGFPCAEESFAGNQAPDSRQLGSSADRGFAGNGGSESRQQQPPDHSPPQSNPNSLMKLQKLTRQISVESPSASTSYSRAPGVKGTFSTPQTHLRRPRYTGVPERPASVQPPVIPPMEKPHPSTPPAGLVDRPRDGYYGNKDSYARGNTLASGEYPYNYGRSWEQGVQHFPRHNPGYPTYEQSWPPGAFGTYPGYSPQAPHCQLERQYATQKFTHPSGGNYPQNNPHNPMLMNPNRQTAWGGRDPYEQGPGYDDLGVRPPFPTHEMHPRPPNLHPYYGGATYPGYTNQGGYSNTFPHR